MRGDPEASRPIPYELTSRARRLLEETHSMRPELARRLAALVAHVRRALEPGDGPGVAIGAVTALLEDPELGAWLESFPEELLEDPLSELTRRELVRALEVEERGGGA